MYGILENNNNKNNTTVASLMWQEQAHGADNTVAFIKIVGMWVYNLFFVIF